MKDTLSQPSALRSHLPQKAESVVRILIASYFFATALHLIPGTDFTALTALILPERFADLAALAIVAPLAYLVLIGGGVTRAALCLATITFFAAYTAFLAAETSSEIAAFWRDLALIGGLLAVSSEAPASEATTVVKPRRITRARPAFFASRRRAPPAPAMPLQAAMAELPADAEAARFLADISDLDAARAQKPRSPRHRPTDLRAPLNADEIETMFRDVRNIAKAV